MKESVEDRLDAVITDLYPRTSLAVLAFEATEEIRRLRAMTSVRTVLRAVIDDPDTKPAYRTEIAQFLGLLAAIHADEPRSALLLLLGMNTGMRDRVDELEGRSRST